MKRREFVAGAGGLVASWPLVARAQQARLPVVGWMHGGSPGPNRELVQAFLAGLAETGHVDGRNVKIDFRWTNGDYTLFDALAREFVAARVAVIAAIGNANSVKAAMRATTSIPILFANAADPIEAGFVKHMNRPDGNVTGISYITSLMGPKRLELLCELIPPPAPIGLLVNPKNLISAGEVERFRDAARALNRSLAVFEATDPGEIDTAFAAARGAGAGAMLVNTDVYFTSLRDQVVAIAAKYSMPSAYHLKEFTQAGGLISYGDDRASEYQDTGRYAGKLLGGAKVADLPVLQPRSFELVVNLKTAKALGLDISEAFLTRANMVIE